MTMAFPLAAVFGIGEKLIDRLWPDPSERDAAKLKLLEMQQTGELAHLASTTELAKGQLEVNAVEAAHNRLFVAGWRPFVGWTCGAAVAFKFIGGPVLFMVAQAFDHPIELPEIDTAELWPLLIGMLGLGGLRTVEKVKGAA
jgi:hypothetical protein